MAQFIKVAKIGELADGDMKEVMAQKSKVLLARAGEKYFATESRCPHVGAPLANGTLEGTVITCPFHGSQFDITDGRIISWTPNMPKLTPIAAKLGKLMSRQRPLKMYPVKVEGEDISVQI